ncbi:MAG: response regulator [Hormoscilla sp.]
MQGQLSEIDIRSILQLIELGQRTGELFVEAYASGPGSGDHSCRLPSSQSWFVFFLNGKIIYAAADTDSNLLRLRDYLRYYKKDAANQEIRTSKRSSINAPEYGYLWAMLENHDLTPAQGRAIIGKMVHETLFDLLSLHQGSFIFEVGPALAPQLTTLDNRSLVTKIMQQMQEWMQFHPHIQSPNQCPVIANHARLSSSMSKNNYRILRTWADGKSSMRQIARYLNGDVLTVAKVIYPYVQEGCVQLVERHDGEPTAAKKEWPSDRAPFGKNRIPRIVCIDDSVAICKAVESMLKQHYEVAAIGDPIKALSMVFQLKPDLILCDIAMPELDGYEICAMLRRSTVFRQTPIVMLTGKDGFIDRVKARMVGATDYLTKPFGEGELLTISEIYLGRGPSGVPGSLASRPLDDGSNTVPEKSESANWRLAQLRQHPSRHFS